jgi:two-component system chemotaxis sensor kinase CheA
VNPQEYLHIFLDETREHLLSMQHWLAVLAEQPGDRQGIDALFRSVHSIKGMAASMGFRQLAGMAHAMENGLARLRRTNVLPVEALDRLYTGVDALEQRFAEIATGHPDSSDQVDPGGTVAPGQHTQQLRIRMQGADVSRWLLLVNALMRLGTLRHCDPDPEKVAEGTLPEVLDVELLGTCTLDEIVERCRAVFAGVVVEAAPACGSTSAPMRHGVGQATVRVSTTVLDRFVGLTGELLTVRHRLQESLQRGRREDIESSCLQLDRLLGDLRYQVLDARMVPLETVTATLPGLVRDLCRKTGKKIRLKLAGTEVRLDRAILEALSEPLMHMVRNAVDHGIEECGTITIEARRDRDRVTLDVSDDGRGLDRVQLVECARREGLCGAGPAASLSDAELLQLICRPGLSTASHLTETSGRGVGMDVVRHTVDRLGGSLQILGDQQSGTCFRFILPLTVSIVPVLLVMAGGQLLALPTMWIEQTLDVPGQQWETVGDRHMACFGTRKLPVCFLSDLLGLTASSRPASSNLVCELRGGQAALAVDAVMGQQDVFVKPLSFPLDHIPGLSGVTILGNGQVVFLLDPSMLLLSCRPPVCKGDPL